MKDFLNFNFNSIEHKPKMRWWLPGAFVDDNEIEREIRDMDKAGFGGAEILYFFGIPTNEIKPENYAEYYFGSKQWNNRMKHALLTAIELGFKLDFTVGPLWPIATPAIQNEDDERTSWGLHVGAIDFKVSFEGELPIPDTIRRDKGYHVVTASIAKKVQEDGSVYHLESAINIIKRIDIEDRKCVIHLSDLFDAQNKVDSSPEDTWTMFVYYAQHSGQRNDSSETFVIDHLSKDAAVAVTQYWETALMGDDEIRILYELNGGDLFCDSIEVSATMIGGMYDARPLPVIIWTPRLLEIFECRRGYDLTPYMQCLFIEGLYQNSSTRNPDRPPKYGFKEEHVNRQIQNDYYQTLTELINDNHILVFREWANSHNMKLRYQVYGLPTDMATSLSAVDVPETESLGFEDCIDANLLLSGAVHMYKKPIYSYELGAQQGKAYEQTWTKSKGLLWQTHQAMAAGVNQVVLHGMSYNSTSVVGQVEPIFKWPGLSLMGTSFSNEWGDRQPIWEHISLMTTYISRLQWILRQGNPRVDVAIYRQEYNGANYAMDKEINLMSKAGYSYEYIGSNLLSEYYDTVYEAAGQYFWDKDGASYKALIVDYQKDRGNNEWQSPLLSLRDMKNILKLAESGLAIFWTIGEPQFCSSYQTRGDLEQIKQVYRCLNQLPSFHKVPTNHLLQSLYESEIFPDRQSENDSKLIHVHRSCKGKDFYYLYNQCNNQVVRETISLSGEGKPYLLNCWDGDIHEIEGYSRIDKSVRFQISLHPNEAIVLLIGTLEGEFPVALSDDLKWSMLDLKEWDLTVKSYQAGEKPYLTRFEQKSYNRVNLIPWSQISGLEDISGIGIYRCNIKLTDQIKRCVISMGDVIDTAKVIVNGTEIMPNQISKEADITRGICIGENEILIEIATTLNNALVSSGEKKVRQDFGLIGPIKLMYI